MKSAGRREGTLQGRSRRSGRVALAATAILAVLAGGLVPTASMAAAGDAELSLQKSVVGQPITPTYAPGDTFQYQLDVSCASLDAAGCINAAVTDTLPAPLVFGTPAVQSVTGVGARFVVSTAGNTATVGFNQLLDGTDVGLEAGTSDVTIILNVRVPDGLTVQDAGTVTNTANATASNALTVPASTLVDIEVEQTLSAAASKSAQSNMPAGQPIPAVPGRVVGWTLGGSNTSNTTVDSLTVQDPGDAASDPFTLLALTGITSLRPPAGADTVDVLWRDAGGAWTSVAGPVVIPANPNELLAGLTLADVHGLRFVFTNSAGGIGIQPIAAGAAIQLATVTRPTVVDIPDGSTVTVTDTAQVQVSNDGATSPNANASASVQIRRIKPTVAITKVWDRPTVLSGETRTATIGASVGEAPVARMVITEPGAGGLTLQQQGLDFVSWTTADLEWPVGATGATITYAYTDGAGAPQSTATRDTLPAPQAGRTVDGFTVEFTGLMDAAQFASLPFLVRAQPVPGQADVRSLNSASAQVFDELGQQSDVGFSEAALIRQPLRITASIQKEISRDWIWSAAGSTSLVQLPAAVSVQDPNASTVGAQSLVVSDPGDPQPGDPPTDFWDHFDLQQIVSTEVPAGSQLTITYWNGTAWVNLPGGAGVNIPGPSSGFTYTPSAALREQIQGIRYSFTSLPAGGLLPPGFNVLPYYRVELRDSLRSDPGVDLNGASGVVTNDAAATVLNPNASPGSSTATDTDSIELRPASGGPGSTISKGWLVGGVPSDDSATTTAQSDAQSSLRITWGTNLFPFDAVTITDPATDPADVVGSVYDAFDLVRIQPITAASDPLMTFDAVSEVSLYSSATAGWVDITSSVCGPTGALCDGTFPGHTLTTAQQASTLAVRITFVESPTRASRATSPTDPAVGTGVAGSGIVRPLDLTYQIRQDRRSDPTQAVLGTANGYTYNSGIPGVVDNTASLVGVDPDVSFTSVDGSSITILDSPLNVRITKVFDQTDVGIPPSDTDPTLYPLVTASILATNASASKVRQLTLSDPSPTQVGPSIYETMNLYQIGAISVPSGATATTVTLSRGAVSTTYTIAQALALSSSALADVTGVQVQHNGFIGAQGVAGLTLVYQERPLTRSSAEPILPGAVGLNVAQADIVSPGGTPANVPTATAADDLIFVLPTYSVSATKSFNASSRYEDQSNAYTVSLRSRPAGTARTTTLTFEDATPTFWNAFSFTSFPQVSLPAPVRRIKVDALVGVTYALDGSSLVASCGGSTDLTACWVNGVYATANPTTGAVTPALPTGVSASQVRGLRFSFQTATGGNWERPFNPEVLVPFNVTRNALLRYGIGGSTTQPVPSTQPGILPAPGEPVQGTTTDTLDVDAVASWRNGPSLWEAEASSTATTTLLHRATSLRILKTPTGPQSPENDIDFTITVTNTGARAISNLILTDLSSVDVQGALLRPAERDAGDTSPIFSFGLLGANGQAKPVTGFSAGFSTTTGQLAINVPPGFVFAVGDVLTIFADLQFRIGLEPETPVLNTVTAIADRILDSCVGSVNTVPQATVTNVPDCVASTQVTPTPAAPLRITKWVKGSGAGIPGVDPADPNYDDLGTLAFNVPTNQCLTANGVDGYWRTPCIPITRPGGTETWKIEVTNLGNIPATVISGIDVLPSYGDTGVIINSPRQSAWPVTFAGNVQYLSGLTSGETRRAYYMTTVPNTACNSADILRDTSGTILPSNPCYADVTTRNWIPLTDTMTPAQMASVRALKVVVDFENRAIQGLPPGESLRVTYDTTTAWQPVRAETQDRDAIAWNSVAIGARGVLNDLDYVTTVVEPRKIGVAMATGKVDLSKQVDVPDGWDPGITMPTSYDFDVSCTSGPEQVDLVDVSGASMSRVNLAADGTVLHYADGATPATSAWSHVNLPLYAECSIAEATPTPGVLIDYSDQPVTALRDWSNRTNVVNAAYPDPIELNEITAINTYQLGGFSVEKAVDNGPAVDQDGVPIQYVDDYEFTASCIFLGQEVLEPGQRVFIAVPDGEVVEFTGLPAGSQCRVVETNASGAAATYTQVSVSGVPGPNEPDPTADFVLVPDLPASTAPQVALTVTNVYTAGSASLTKVIAGAGGAAWGDGDFTVSMRCTLAWGDPQLVFEDTVTVNRASPTWLVSNLARGAVCTVSETSSGGANSTTITPATFTVTDAAQPSLVTVTNTFTTGSLSVSKALSGSPAASLTPATQGTYTVSLACTRVVNGGTVAVTIPGGATRTILGAGTATYTGLPTGAVCTVTEPGQGFASSHTVAPASLTIGSGTTVAATVTNVFPNGALALTKVVSGPGADQAPATFGATVTCLWHGAPVPLAAAGRVTLRPGATTVVSNIPVDSVCSIAEDDAGQDDTIYTPSTAVIVPNTSPTATIRTENVYLLASLRVAKDVDPNEGAVPTGFGMSVECTFRGSTVLPLTTFTLDGGQFRDFTGLPSRSSCTIIETDNRGAAATVSQVIVESPTAPPVVTQSRNTVVIPELTRDLVAGQPRNRVTFTNLFDVSGMLLEKDFAGTAAGQIGVGMSFTLDVVCVNAGEIVLDESPVLGPENGYTVAYFPIAAQTRCEITEPDSGFADATVITPNEGDPSMGVIIIPSEGVGSVAVTNWYLGGSLDVTKVLTGEAAEKFGTGDFEVTLTCTLRDADLEIADGPSRTISATSPTATFTALPTGAECRVVESDPGGATRHWLADADGVPLEVDEDGGYTFTVVTDPAELTDADQPQQPVTAVNEFLFAAVTATKAVRTFSGGVPENAPATFPIQVTCTLEGLPVSALENALQFVAVGGTATWTELPVGAACEITETDAGEALATTVAVDDGAPVAGRTTTIVLEESSAESPSVAAFLNTFSDPLPVTGAPVPWAGILLGGGMLLLGLGLVLMRRRRA